MGVAVQVVVNPVTSLNYTLALLASYETPLLNQKGHLHCRVCIFQQVVLQLSTG